jgi:hypothetical protein
MLQTSRNTVMPAYMSDPTEEMDRKTSRSICNAVGERLQQSLPPEPTALSDHLQQLMDELRRRDDIAMRFK